MSTLAKMISNRLAYKLRLVSEEHDRLFFTDKRYILTIRIMMLLFTGMPLTLLYVMHSKTDDIPIEVDIFLGSFAAIFFMVFVFKSFFHKELEMTKLNKNISVLKKMGSKVSKETNFNFSQVKSIETRRIARKDTLDNGTSQTRSHYEIILTFNTEEEVAFTVVNDFETAKKFAGKISEFVGFNGK